MRLFRKSRSQEQVQIRVVHASAMRAKQWRGSPALVQYAQQLLASAQFQTLLAVLRNESPSNFGLAGGTHDDHIAHAYRAEGYSLALNNLESLAITETEESALEATFEREEPKQPQS